MSEATGDLPPSLARFASTVHDPVARELTLRTLRWAETQGLLQASRHPTPELLVLVASVYSWLCAPPRPTPRSLDLTARFTLLFFHIDDAPTEGIAAFVSDASDWSIGPLTAGLRSWLADLYEFDTCPAPLRESFKQHFHDYLRARKLEPAVTSKTLPLDAHWQLRRHTIFMEPYLDQWMISTRIDTDTFRREDFAPARQLATDLVLLSNDLGSIDRDRPDGDSPDDLNLVNAHVHQLGLSLDEALERLIAHHNELVARYRAALREALGTSPTPAAVAYAELLTGVVDGNLGSLRALTFRYRNVDHIIERLHSV